MNYKKLKRVFALGMAVLLSVSTSVYGGTMEVHAAEAISNDLLKNEVIDNSSLDENTENKGDVQGDTQGAGQGDRQDNAQDAVVLTEQDEKPAALAATMAAPSGVAKTEVGYSNELNLGFSDAAWVNSITALKVGNDSFEKVNSFGFFESGNKFIAGSYSFDGGANGDLPALRIITKNITFPVIAVISADGYEDLKLNTKTSHTPNGLCTLKIQYFS